ncbi:hypothetical protein L195_g029990 [Trifolium pratense]|uniref:Uncharacterized protein n=1 Tax=Trifolium pratense TaxID=57577 RepID=A0A2K3L6C2_TRIPR|nr:hypothetical protein L195_g029990 [Trifolium pratense]
MEATDNNSSESTVQNDSERLPGMVNWGPATVIAVFAGMLYGGSREASSSVVSLSPNAPKLCFMWL